MICSICGDEVDLCVNCFKLLPHDFFCYEDMHFCLKSCWEGWLIYENEHKVQLAEQVSGYIPPEERED